VSEYPPGTRAEPFRFPARNRIVAALSRAVVIVEGAAGSGSMITADHAIDLGLEVSAVPGPVTSELSHVPLKLIRDGARMIRGADDLLEDLGIAPCARRRAGSGGGRRGAPGLTETSGPSSSTAAPFTAEPLAARAGMELPR
jgi:DNA processing protein